MNIFKADRIMNRLDQMIDNAIDGKPIENGFDETKMSALETKLSRYLAMNNAGKTQLAEEKLRINELISDISHQTKTPIANILLYAQLLEEGELPDKEKECAKSLVGQAEKLNFLIASLVKASRLENGIIAVAPKHYKIKSLFDSVQTQARQKADSKKIKLSFAPTEISAVFDQKWTAEALYNIVDNAIKYSPCGGSVAVTAKAYELFCRIDIADTGMGISEDETAKIFSRFYRSPAVSNKEGVGIGLYLARKIVAGEGGYIKVSSEVGKGSTFSVFLPMKS